MFIYVETCASFIVFSSFLFIVSCPLISQQVLKTPSNVLTFWIFTPTFLTIISWGLIGW